MRRFKQCKIICFAALVILLACRTKSQPYFLGVRGGASFQNGIGNFQQADIFAGMYLPWSWGPQDGLNLNPRLESSAGWLVNRGNSGLVGTLGPALELRMGKFPVTLVGGASFAGISRSDFPDRNLGGWFQFTEHVGLDWRITKHFTVGWRYQHMSNAGIYKQNPGLNLQMLSATYNF